jgi:hypothetical protein
LPDPILRHFGSRFFLARYAAQIETKGEQSREDGYREHGGVSLRPVAAFATKSTKAGRMPKDDFKGHRKPFVRLFIMTSD